MVRLPKKKDITKAAAEAFLEKGYGNTSMDYIAEKAGVSKQTIYSNFKNKEELFCGMIEGKCDEISSPMSESEYEALDPESFLTSLGNDFLCFIVTQESINLHRIIIAESHRFPELSKIFFEQGTKKGLKKLVTYFKAHNKKGTLKINDLEKAAQIYIEMLKGPMIQGMLMGFSTKPSKKEIKKHVDEVVRVFLSAYENNKS